MEDLLKLEQRIDAQTKNPSKMTADMGRTLQSLYRAKIGPSNLPALIEDQKIVISVPLNQRVSEPAESTRASQYSMRQSSQPTQAPPARPESVVSSSVDLNAPIKMGSFTSGQVGDVAPPMATSVELAKSTEVADASPEHPVEEEEDIDVTVEVVQVEGLVEEDTEAAAEAEFDAKVEAEGEEQEAAEEEEAE